MPNPLLQDQVKSVCLSEKPRSMSINCPSNKITRILKAYYGYSWSGDCHFIEKDCIVDVPNEDLSCLGEGCSVKIIDSPIILQECWNLMASYIQIDYECIPVEELQNMCTIQESERSVGYIVTPSYPSYLDMDLSCPCTLSAPKGFTVAVEVLDFRLPSCSQAGLTLWSDSATYTHCLTIAGGVLPGSESQNISMRLHSETRKLNAGFLLNHCQFVN
ncbi:mannan-binding lectin serine protease 2-like [Brachionus plicatilis]|uniref:Mannan-binding lectin serine protease 2-like n=1 Tax=Brachionus plicatilis TaxID=10195 RepID=A0A3M7SC34_BRAPC|nr:mannan-binding lectin serine protease 2-like [Brachionus plicatilis]